MTRGVRRGVLHDVPPELDALVLRATDRDPAARPADAGALLAELRRVAHHLEVPLVPVPVPPHRQWVGTVGSVGQPRDGDPRAMYALLDTDHWHLRFERVPYAVADAAAAILATGGALPASFAHRLGVGR